MTTVYVLIMLWGASTSQSGMMQVTQEFNGKEKCEAAMNHLAKGASNYMVLRSRGCFPK